MKNAVSMRVKLFVIVFAGWPPATLFASDKYPASPPNRSFTFNFLPIENRSGVNVFASCIPGTKVPFGTGAKYDGGGATMCDDNGGGPGDANRYVHDGYIPGSSYYLLEQDETNSIHHMVVIDEAQHFKMEYYISTSSGTAGLTQARDMSGGQSDGHVYPIDPKDPGRTGTGSGDPTRVQYRMLIADSGMTMDMLKNTWNNKPLLTQSIRDRDMSQDLTIDMRNSTYRQMNIPASVTFTASIAGNAPVTYDSRDNGGANITGGRFMITGYSSDPVDPHYKYADAPVDYGKNLNWLSYWHGSQYWKPGDPYSYSSK